MFDISLPSPPVPPGYVEYFTKRTGNIYYEDLNTGQKWFTALDGGSRLYFYTETEEGSRKIYCARLQSCVI